VADELVAYADGERHLFLARTELTMTSARRKDLAGVGGQLTAADQVSAVLRAIL